VTFIDKEQHMRQLWLWLFGKDVYFNGEHIAHTPSLFQRCRVKRKVKKHRDKIVDGYLSHISFRDLYSTK